MLGYGFFRKCFPRSRILSCLHDLILNFDPFCVYVSYLEKLIEFDWNKKRDFKDSMLNSLNPEVYSEKLAINQCPWKTSSLTIFRASFSLGNQSIEREHPLGAVQIFKLSESARYHCIWSYLICSFRCKKNLVDR